MKRREFVTSVIAGGLAVPALADEGHGHHRPMDGPLANATVSFGAWPSEPPLDRMNLPPGPAPNIHQLIPYVATVKAGGSVNFIIAGFHNIAVYGPGTKPTDINTSLTAPVPGAPSPTFPRIIDDPVNRVYRGPFSFTIAQDRVEVVHFPTRGLYLVICAFVPHFNDEMWGYVRVLR